MVAYALTRMEHLGNKSLCHQEVPEKSRGKRVKEEILSSLHLSASGIRRPGMSAGIQRLGGQLLPHDEFSGLETVWMEGFQSVVGLLI